MPKGVYPRTKNQLKAAKANLAKGRLPEARAKAAKVLRELGQDPAWREQVSQATRKAMRRPDVRAKHLAGLAGQPVNFKGGNGQPITRTVRAVLRVLGPAGFVRELVIPTKGHGTEHHPPTSYKVDLGHPDLHIAVELDGPSHRPIAKQRADAKKTAVLQALGWRVVRIRHE